MIRSWPSLLIGLCTPVVLTLGGVLALGSSTTVVLGFPLVFVWVFCCCPVTTICLWVSWHFFDSPHYTDREPR